MAGRNLRRERLGLAVRSQLDDPTAGRVRRQRLADLVDGWLRDVWDTAAPAPGSPRGAGAGVALAAIGGHARRDAGPASDLDLVLLHDGRCLPEADVAALADQVWYPLWDAGLRLDHSVRSVADCRQVASADLPALVGLLDLRPVAGDAGLVLRARDALRDQWRRTARPRLPALLESVTQRAEAHGELAYLLEGDLKEARGGLRDVVVLQALVATWLADVPHAVVTAAAGRLLDVRDALHTVTGRPGERLLLPEQDAVAAALGLPDADALLAEVAVAARAVAYALDRTARQARRAVHGPRLSRLRGPRPRPVGRDLLVHEGEVCLGATARPCRDPSLAVRAAAAAATRRLPLSPVTAEHLATAGSPLPEPWPAEARQAFTDLLGTGAALPAVWEVLDQVGIVTTWVQEWAAVRNRPQRTAVHRHTVDRHLVQTCVEAAALVRDVARPDLLLLAALFHDLGKRPGASDHAAVGAALAGRATRRMGLDPADVDVVERLVREHLTLVELATRRDPDDPRTVEALVTAVDGREDVLDLLRALTEADARAAGPLAWSVWRARLVDDLVARARTALRGEPQPPPAPLKPTELVLVIEVRRDGAPRVTVVEEEGAYVVGVVACDRPGLFADVAGVLAAHGFRVRSALVRTVDGVAVHSSWVETTGPPPDPAVLVTTLNRLQRGDVRPLERIARRDDAWRPQRLTATQPRVLLVPGAAADATVVEVRAADRPGLLHALGRALVDVAVDVRSAHVATYSGQAVDVLYLREPGGAVLSPPRVGAVVAALAAAADVP